MTVMLSERKDKPKLASEVLNRRLGKSTPASRKASKCHRHSSASTLLICLRPTEPVKRVCYADDITVCATAVKIPDLENSEYTSYLEEIIAYQKDNSLLISAPKVNSHAVQSQIHTKLTPIREYSSEDSQLPLAQCPKILGVYIDTSLSFNKHSGYVAGESIQ